MKSVVYKDYTVILLSYFGYQESFGSKRDVGAQGSRIERNEKFVQRRQRYVSASAKPRNTGDFISRYLNEQNSDEVRHDLSVMSTVKLIRAVETSI